MQRFFPCRVAGPIKRFNDFTASVADADGFAVDVYHGCFRILCGLAVGHFGLVPRVFVICRCHAGTMVGKALVIKPPGPYQADDGAPHGDQKGTRFIPRLPPQL